MDLIYKLQKKSTVLLIESMKKKVIKMIFEHTEEKADIVMEKILSEDLFAPLKI